MNSNNKSRGTVPNILFCAAILLSLGGNMNKVNATMNCLQLMRSDHSATLNVAFTYCLSDDSCL